MKAVSLKFNYGPHFHSMLDKLRQAQPFNEGEKVAFRKYKLMFFGNEKYTESIEIGEILSSN